MTEKNIAVSIIATIVHRYREMFPVTPFPTVSDLLVYNANSGPVSAETALYDCAAILMLHVIFATFCYFFRFF
jgi:hypothetical protein